MIKEGQFEKALNFIFSYSWILRFQFQAHKWYTILCIGRTFVGLPLKLALSSEPLQNVLHMSPNYPQESQLLSLLSCRNKKIINTSWIYYILLKIPACQILRIKSSECKQIRKKTSIWILFGLMTKIQWK